MSNSGEPTEAIGQQLHQQTRRPMTTLMLLLGVGIIVLASERTTLPVGDAPLRWFLGLYVICIVGAMATLSRGVRDPLYLAFNWTETVVLTLGVGLLIVKGGTAHSLLWLLYFSTVLHGARAALYRRFNYTLFAITPVVIAAAFAASGDHADAVLALVLGAAALYLHRLFLAATDRQLELERDRERLRQRVASLAVVEERERIARDLHDGLGASLTAAVWQARRTESPSIMAIEDRLLGCLDELGALVWTTRRNDRDLVAFWSHLRARCDDLFGAEVRIDYTLRGDGSILLDDRVAVATMFIVFEALRNCVRHACARNACVSGSVTAEALTIEICDDGIGFDPAVLTTGFGLQNMAERVRGARGVLAVHSKAGETIIRARFPSAALS